LPESRPALDNLTTPRHDFGAVTRALRFLALITALFVVTVRCLSGFPLAATCVAALAAGATEACPASDQPGEQDTLAPVALDDLDDDVDPVVAPSPLRIRLLTEREPTGADCGALVAARALPSHAPSLERPPRV